MKKVNIFLAILSSIALLLVLFLASCSKDEDNTHSLPSVSEQASTDSIFVYSRYGIAEYSYNENNNITEIVYLDPMTMNEYILGKENYICKYSYDERGNLCDLVYMGKSFKVNSVNENGCALSAVCTTEEPIVTVNFQYNTDGVIIKEDFYQNNIPIISNEFDDDGKPIGSEFYDAGTITYDYAESEVFTTIKYKDSNEQAPDFTLYLDEGGYPYAFLQSYETAMMGYMWSYDNNMQCTNTLVESIYDGQKYSEEYLILYDESSNISKILHYSYDAEGTPAQEGKYEYFYTNSSISEQIDSLYNEDGKLNEKKLYKYENYLPVETITEKYTDDTLVSKEVVSTEYDSNGRTITKSTSNFDGNELFTSGSEEKYSYKENGTISKRITTAYKENKSLLHIFTEEYETDENGNVLRAVYTATDPDNKLIEREIDEFEYNAKGELVLKSISFYDSQNQLRHRDAIVNNYKDGVFVNTTTTRYDAEGNVIGTSTTEN